MGKGKLKVSENGRADLLISCHQDLQALNKGLGKSIFKYSGNNSEKHLDKIKATTDSMWAIIKEVRKELTVQRKDVKASNKM